MNSHKKIPKLLQMIQKCAKHMLIILPIAKEDMKTMIVYDNIRRCNACLAAVKYHNVCLFVNKNGIIVKQNWENNTWA